MILSTNNWLLWCCRRWMPSPLGRSHDSEGWLGLVTVQEGLDTDGIVTFKASVFGSVWCAFSLVEPSWNPAVQSLKAWDLEQPDEASRQWSVTLKFRFFFPWKLFPAHSVTCDASLKWSALDLLSGSRCWRLHRMSGCFCQLIDGATVGTDQSSFSLLVSSTAASYPSC